MLRSKNFLQKACKRAAVSQAVRSLTVRLKGVVHRLAIQLRLTLHAWLMRMQAGRAAAAAALVDVENFAGAAAAAAAAAAVAAAVADADAAARDHAAGQEVHHPRRGGGECS